MNCLLLRRLTSAVFGILVLTIDPTPGQVQKSKVLTAADALLVISAKESSVKSGAAIWVNIAIENKSDHELFVYSALTGKDDDQGGWVYHADVQDEKGQKPLPTGFEKRISIGSGGYIHLQPGKTVTDRINICKLYDVIRPGKYSIQVYRTDYRETLRSNTITVTVTP